MPQRNAELTRRLTSPFRRAWAWAAPMLRVPHLWLGLLIGLGGLGAIYLAFNEVVMPAYTRQGAEVIVPEVRELAQEEALRMIEDRRLRAEVREQPFNPSFDRNVVLDQNPAANSVVKPGRRIYLYINSGTERTVSMPEVRTLTESVARSELTELGLTRVQIEVDEQPSPYAGTVTRQEPAAGETVRSSEIVRLWVSPGLGDPTVEVPDVRGLAYREASVELEEAGLWVDPTRIVSGTITRQEPAAGSIARVGTEVRLSSAPIEDEPLPERQEYEEGIPPFIEVPPGEEIPDIDEETPPAPERPRDPDRIDW